MERRKVSLQGIAGSTAFKTFSVPIQYCSHRDDGWHNFYKSIVNFPSETAPKTLLECRRNYHLHYLWNPNLNSTVSIKLHFFSHGREYGFPLGLSCQVTSSTSITSEPRLYAAISYLAPCHHWSGRGNEYSMLKWKNNLFLEPLSLTAIKTVCGSPRMCWPKILKSSVKDVCTGPAFSSL